MDKLIKLLETLKLRYIIKDEEIYINVGDSEDYLGTTIEPTDNKTKCFQDKILYPEERKHVRYMKSKDWLNFFSSYDIDLDVEFLDLFKSIDFSNRFNIAIIDFLKNNKGCFSYIIKNGEICLTLSNICERFTFTSLNKNNKMYKKYIINTPYRKTNYINPEGLCLVLINYLSRYEYINLFTNEPNEILKREFIDKGVKVEIYDNTLCYYSNHVMDVLSTYKKYIQLISNKIITNEDVKKTNSGVYFTEETIFKILKNFNSLSCFEICKRNHIKHNTLEGEIFINDKVIDDATLRVLEYNNMNYYRNHDVYKYFGNYLRKIENKDCLMFYDDNFVKPYVDYLSEECIKMGIYDKFKHCDDYDLKRKLVEINNKFGLNIDFKYNILHNINSVEKDELLFKNLTGIKDARFDNILSVKYGLDDNKEVFIIAEGDIKELAMKYFGYYPNQVNVFITNEGDLVRAVNFDLFIRFLPRLKSDLAAKYMNELGLCKSYFKLFENHTFPIIESALPHVKFEKQYVVKRSKKLNYYLDLAIPDRKICIECDENNHQHYNKKKEKEREEYLNKNGWKILRYNPHYPESIGSVICELYKSFSLN